VPWDAIGRGPRLVYVADEVRNGREEEVRPISEFHPGHRATILGLIGGPLIIASGTAVLFNVIQPGSAAQFIATISEFVWELSLGIYLMVKGFKPSPILSGTIGDVGAYERSPALAALDR
jgi:hypothetical protein